MTAAVDVELTFDESLRALALDLRQLATNLSRPRLSDSRWLRAARAKHQELSDRVASLMENLTSRRQALSETLSDLRGILEGHAAELARRCSGPRVRDMRATLTRTYEDFVAQVRALKIWKTEELELRALRAPRPFRSLVHVATGVGCMLLYQLVVTREQALTILASFASLFTVLEVTRRFSSWWNDFLVFRVFGLISRPRERYQTNSASYFLLAMLIITWFAPQPAVCLAFLVLGIGDPVASYVGSRWGRLRLKNDKSVVGSSAFFLSALVATSLYGLIAIPGLSLPRTILIAATVSIVGTLVEMFSDRLDDNFTIPILCAATGMLFF